MQRITFTFLAIFCALAGTTLFLGNSSGAAANGNYYTGAPSAGGGMEATCSVCHRSGNFGEPELTVTFAEAGSDDFGELSSYVPGATYQVSVAVGYTMAAPAGYGFQAQIITDAGSPPSAAGTLEGLSENTKISNGRSDRRYAEHTRTSNDSVFVFSWTAPEAGTGAVSMYTVGNLVNRAAGTGGDNGSTRPTIINLPEGSPSSVGSFASLPAKIYPNPVSSGQRALLDLTLPAAGLYTVSVADATGRQLQTIERSLTAGAQQLPLDLAEMKPGLYLVTANGQGHHWTGKLVVR